MKVLVNYVSVKNDVHYAPLGQLGRLTPLPRFKRPAHIFRISLTYSSPGGRSGREPKASRTRLMTASLSSLGLGRSAMTLFPPPRSRGGQVGPVVAKGL